MSNVRRVSITLHRDGYWLLVIEPRKGGSYSERFEQLETAAAMVPGAAERFRDSSAPGLEYYEHEGSE